ncbi:MAG: PBP1A family penicillin-binding protein [Deltaproteobacteria bacterium]|nr:PBP1A family penicillin-binding protein [Deltaproteobacteria bacterium]
MPKRLQKDSLHQSWRPRRRKRRLLFRIFVLSLALAGILAILIGAHVKRLEKIVERKFSSVTRRWNIPSRVYSDAFYLYPGVDLARREVIKKLDRLAYRKVAAVQGPGDFSLQPGSLEIYLHDFAYPQEKFAGFPVRIEKEGEIVRRLTDLESGEELPLVKLEPEEMAAIFDEKMEDRTIITLKDCPQHLLEAIILIEDERFFKHKGIDPVAIARAAVADLLAMKIVQGGSTLTQQLVKNFFLTSKKAFRRKFNEALMSMILERKHTKAEILEAYLNEIYLGQRGTSSVTGVAEAAKHYFAKEVHQIGLAESALLAGLIRNPSLYSPFRDKEKAIARRDFILKKMLEQEIIDEEKYQQAATEELVTPKVELKPVFARYFIDFLKTQLADFYPEEVLETEGLRIFTTLDMTMQFTAKEALNEGLADLEKKFGHLLPEEYREGKLQGCLVAISPQNGYVRAMVGGRDYAESQFNRCTQAARQPGSTFKPFVYLTALDPGRAGQTYTLASLVEDKTFEMETPEGPWSPQNYDKKEHGLVTLRTALEKSYNIATVKLALNVGLEKIVRTAHDAGITSPLSPFPSLALGVFEVSPLELAQAFAVFPNRGLRTRALSIIHVTTSEGDVLEKETLKIQRAFDEAPIALVTSAMQGVMERGTAAAVRAFGFHGKAAGKTGTTSDYRDAWFAGFTPDLLALVWTGFDDNTPIEMSGARAALPIWSAFMKKVAGESTAAFTFPKEIVQVAIDPETGGLATRQCPVTFTEYFIEGTEPTELCPHKTGKLLPSIRSPAESVEEEF